MNVPSAKVEVYLGMADAESTRGDMQASVAQETDDKPRGRTANRKEGRCHGDPGPMEHLSGCFLVGLLHDLTPVELPFAPRELHAADLRRMRDHRDESCGCAGVLSRKVDDRR